MNAGNLSDSEGRERDEDGIIAYHAYTILDIKKCERKNAGDIILFRIRNPHGIGSKEGNRKWSDGDDENWSTLGTFPFIFQKHLKN